MNNPESQSYPEDEELARSARFRAHRVLTGCKRYNLPLPEPTNPNCDTSPFDEEPTDTLIGYEVE